MKLTRLGKGPLKSRFAKPSPTWENALEAQKKSSSGEGIESPKINPFEEFLRRQVEVQDQKRGLAENLPSWADDFDFKDSLLSLGILVFYSLAFAFILALLR